MVQLETYQVEVYVVESFYRIVVHSMRSAR